MSDSYIPGPGADWETQAPEAAGFDPQRLHEAIDAIQASDSPWQEDIRAHLMAGHFEPPPYNEIVGPTRPRGGPAGLILRGGRIVAEWGDTARTDMTFSVAKSVVSTCAGLAWDRGLLPKDLDAPVRELVKDGGFEPPHNDGITWTHLLQQTSEWEGELFGKPDAIDRNRDVSFGGDNSRKGEARDLAAPGTHWEYNDVRVNRLSLALLRVLGEALPDVLRREIMDPIGATPDWEWHGYSTSWVDVGGRKIQSVSGGGHWGGGMFIGARDLARFGLLMSRGGRWGDRQLLSRDWLRMALAPCPLNPSYGFMWWLNGGQALFPSVSPESYAARGAGGHLVWIDPEHDIVAVIRWIDRDRMDAALGAIVKALA